MDPTWKSIGRSAWARLWRSLAGFVLGTLMLAVVANITSATVTVIAKPDNLGRIANGLVDLVLALAVVFGGGFIVFFAMALHKTLGSARRDRTPSTPLEAHVAGYCQTVRMIAAGHVTARDLGDEPLHQHVSYCVHRVYGALQESTHSRLLKELDPADGYPYPPDDDNTASADPAVADAYIRSRLAELERVLAQLREDG